MLARRPVVNGAVCHFSLASVVLIDCLGASVKRRLTDAGPSATFSCVFYFSFLKDVNVPRIPGGSSVHYLLSGGGGHHIYLTVSLADGCFPSRRFLSLADSSHQRLPRWGTARTAVAGGKAGETAERLMEVNNSKLQKSGCKKRRRAFKAQPKATLFFPPPLTATFGGDRQNKSKNVVILWNGFGVFWVG